MPQDVRFYGDFSGRDYLENSAECSAGWAMGDTVTQRLGALVDFGLANVTLMQKVFRARASYLVMAVFVLGAVALLF